MRGVYRRQDKYDSRAAKDLNELPVAGFLRLVKAENVNISDLAFECVKKLNFIAKLPLIRELFIVNVSCVITKRS